MVTTHLWNYTTLLDTVLVLQSYELSQIKVHIQFVKAFILRLKLKMCKVYKPCYVYIDVT